MRKKKKVQRSIKNKDLFGPKVTSRKKQYKKAYCPKCEEPYKFCEC